MLDSRGAVVVLGEILSVEEGAFSVMSMWGTGIVAQVGLVATVMTPAVIRAWAYLFLIPRNAKILSKVTMAIKPYLTQW